MTEIANFISQVGFPIAAFVLIWWQNNTTTKDMTQAINGLKDKMEDNTTVVGKLHDMISSVKE